jgi:hypothetical protein
LLIISLFKFATIVLGEGRLLLLESSTLYCELWRYFGSDEIISKLSDLISSLICFKGEMVSRVSSLDSIFNCRHIPKDEFAFAGYCEDLVNMGKGFARLLLVKSPVFDKDKVSLLLELFTRLVKLDTGIKHYFLPSSL